MRQQLVAPGALSVPKPIRLVLCVGFPRKVMWVDAATWTIIARVSGMVLRGRRRSVDQFANIAMVIHLLAAPNRAGIAGWLTTKRENQAVIPRIRDCHISNPTHWRAASGVLGGA